MEIENLRPYRDDVLIKEDGFAEQSAGGILLGATQIEKDPYVTGRVVRIGTDLPGRKSSRYPAGYDPELRPNGFQPGDRVFFRRTHGAELPGGHAMLWASQVHPVLLPDGHIITSDPGKR